MPVKRVISHPQSTLAAEIYFPTIPIFSGIQADWEGMIANRIARAVLMGTPTPFLLQTPDNPVGIPKPLLDVNDTMLLADRQHYLAGSAIKFFGLGGSWPAPEKVSPEVTQWALRLTDECSPKAMLACRRAIDETDFRPDLRAFTIPTLILHGDNDQFTPLELCGRRTAQAIPHSQLKVYEGAAHGLFLTHKERVNDDLLAFIQG